ncbi:uncharacterized protein N7498_006086 [Penicillium cinerascens]|uniref:Uncharacterized protein n=1 Tax=Penicillium cinerascens TaxID=70096 RepID=A0A9W9SWT7_9EURO|nr:uncharacterized protein N7498_006086 [Penicillium cinerascens]KAJ5201423.1 hypothetical protein N7498_006086 [Penicillium cinerascens]
MRTSIFLAAALATLAKADDASSTIIGYFIPPWSAGLLSHGGWISTAASVAGINAEAATYHVGCVKGAPKTDCDYPTSWTIIQGPETVSFTGKYIASTSDKSTSYDITVTQSYECSLKSSTESASCTMSAQMSGTYNGGKYDVTTTSSATYTSMPISNSYYRLTVTGGLSSFTAPAATKTGAAAAGPAGAFITAAPMVAAAVAALL